MVPLRFLPFAKSRRMNLDIDVAVVGAGLCGITAAVELQRRGRRVGVFEKSRGLGGRMATRRAFDGFSFNHGAQYFTVRSSPFAERVAQWASLGWVAPWPEKRPGGGGVVSLRRGRAEPVSPGTSRWAPVAGMNSLAKRLVAAEGLDVQRDHPVERLTAGPRGGWRLEFSGQLVVEVPQVLLAVPSPQAADLLPTGLATATTLREIEWDPCWAVMVLFDRPLDLPWAAAFVEDSALAWVARHPPLPENPGGAEPWVLHATAESSRQNFHEDPGTVGQRMMAAFWEAVDQPPRPTLHLAAHRWRYAKPVGSLDAGFLRCAAGLVAAGDWTGGGRIEDAFRSGLLAARAIGEAGEPASDWNSDPQPGPGK